jgi:non-specific serine/threonine protein kinase
MSVFAGSVDLSAIEAVCGWAESGEATMPEIVDGLARKSIIVYEQADTPRFRMLGPIRHYGRGRLAPDLTPEIGDRHARYYEALVAEADDTWFTHAQMTLAERLRSAMPDLRLALQHTLECADAQRGVELATRLFPLWVCLGRLREGEIWLSRALAVQSDARARTLFVYGWVLLATGQIAPSQQVLERAIELAKEQQDIATGDYARGLLGVALVFEGRVSDGVRLCREALALRRVAGDDATVAVLLVLLGEACLAGAQVEEALACSAESEVMCQSLGEHWCLSYALWVRSLAYCAQRRIDDAVTAARASLAIKIDLDDTCGILLVSEVLAWTMAATGKWEDAGQLYAAIQRGGDIGFFPLSDFAYLDTQRASWGRRIVEGLGQDRFRAVAEAAIALRPPDIGRLALGGAGQHRTVRAPTGLLTPRETEVSALVADGMSNREIAARLVISPRTAEVHVERILVKLGFSRREQIAAWWHAGSS